MLDKPSKLTNTRRVRVNNTVLVLKKLKRTNVKLEQTVVNICIISFWKCLRLLSFVRSLRRIIFKCFSTFIKPLAISRVVSMCLVGIGTLFLGSDVLWAQQNIPIPFFDLAVRQANGPGEVSLALQILLLLTIFTIAPSIVIMTTSFVRVSIVLKFVQRALSLQQEPPNQIILGLALFITIFIMTPTMTKIYEEAYVPYTQQKISNTDFFQKAIEPLREFMLKQTREKDIDLFLYLNKGKKPDNPQDVSTVVLVPAFIISEITIAFKIGVYLFIPFIVIDMIVASILMSMGMIMVPPIMISLPFKIILFVLVDGWHLITLQVVRSFNT